MAAWRYVGWTQNFAAPGNPVTRYWTNESDVAYAYRLDDSEIENIPHPSADVYEGVIDVEFDGDVLAWMNYNGVNRESLDDIR